MRRIAICDDNEVQLEQTAQVLQCYAADTGHEVQIELFSDVEECVSNANCFDVVFMDIEFGGGPQGIDAAYRINEAASACQIVYLTNYLHYSLDVYGTEHSWYVLKSQFERRLPEIFGKLDFIKRTRCGSIAIRPIGMAEIVNVPSDEICYLERSLRLTRLVMCDGACYEVRSKLDHLLEKLPDSLFARCHNSYAVNLGRIKRVASTDLDFGDGLSVPLSRSYSKRFRTRYLQWLENRMV